MVKLFAGFIIGWSCIFASVGCLESGTSSQSLPSQDDGPNDGDSSQQKNNYIVVGGSVPTLANGTQTNGGLWFSENSGASFRKLMIPEIGGQNAYDRNWLINVFQDQDNRVGLFTMGSSGQHYWSWSLKAPVTPVEVNLDFAFPGIASTPYLNGKVFFPSATGLIIWDSENSTSQLVTTNQGLPSNAINDIFIDNSGLVYLATSDGVAVSTDAGQNFNSLITGVESLEITARDNVVYVIDNDNPTGIHISKDYGQTFETLHFEGKVSIENMAINSKGVLFFGYGSVDLGIIRVTDFGRNFELIRSVIATQDFVIAPDDTIFVASFVGLYISKDDGLTFSLANGCENEFVQQIAIIEASP